MSSNSLSQNIQTLREDFQNVLNQASTSQDLEEIKVKFLGKKGPIQNLMRFLKDVEASERPQMGKEINDLKELITLQLSEKLEVFINQEIETQLKKESIDVTLPGRQNSIGRKHPVIHTLDQMINALIELGFSVQYGPEIESDFYNFEALNMPSDHPARDMQDTFYITPHTLLRTHTSNIQVRVMESQKPPLRIIAPGKAYRNEDITTRSHVIFHQIEALYVDKGVTFGDLFSTLDQFLKKMFHQDIKIRYRPSYFPFVEPGMEVDISCLICNGQGCSLCKHSGWLEILGAGMVHPEVLKNGGIDPEEYTGYAWGMGVERMANLKYGIRDIRMYTQNDMRFLEQFSFI